MFPKSGCTVVRLLHLYLNEDKDQHLTKTEFEDKHHSLGFIDPDFSKYKNYFKIIVYRSPYDRIISAFYQKIAGVTSSNVHKGGELISQPRCLSKEKNTFNKWLDLIVTGQHHDFHFIPQTIGAECKDFNIINIEDILGIFLNYNKELHTSANKILREENILIKNNLIKYDLPHFEDLTDYDFYKDERGYLRLSEVPNYRYLLTDETKNKIKEHYKDDFLNVEKF